MDEEEEPSIELKHTDDCASVVSPVGDSFADEHFRLAGRPAFKTLSILTLGPFISQLSSAVSGVLSTVWVSKAIGEAGMTAVSTYTAFDSIGRSFGYFCSVAGSQSISSLFGSGQGEEASQVIVDLFRVCIFFGILVPAVLCPTVKLGVKWFGASDEIVDLGYEYFEPLLIGSVTATLFTGAGGFLQGEGRSGLYGWFVIASLVLNVLVFAPLFLFGFKIGIKGAGIATVLGEGLPGCLIMILYFCGKFGVKCNVKQLLKPFSKFTFPALRVGFSQLIANLSVSIPAIITRKLIGLCASDDKMFNDTLSGYNVIFKYAQITNSVIMAITMGYIPSASYAYSAKNYKRWIRLTIHCFWMSACWGTLTAICSWAWPKTIAMVFSDSPGYLGWAAPMVQTGNALGFIVFGRFCFPAVLQSLRKGTTSTILSISSQLVSIIGFALMLYYTNEHDPVRICWCYPLSYAFGLVVGGLVIIPSMIKIWHEYKKANSDIGPNSANNISVNEEPGNEANIQTEEKSNEISHEMELAEL